MHSINLFTFEFKLTFKWFISWFSPKTTSNMASNSKLPNATWYLILGQEETYPFSNEIVSGLHCHFAFTCETFVFSLCFKIHKLKLWLKSWLTTWQFLQTLFLKFIITTDKIRQEQKNLDLGPLQYSCMYKWKKSWQ